MRAEATSSVTRRQ